MNSKDLTIIENAIVIRGGTHRNPHLLLERLFDLDPNEQITELSANLAVANPDESRDLTIIRIAKISRFPHAQIRVSTVEKLRGAGFDLVADRHIREGVLHCNITLPNPASIEHMRRLISAFEAPIPNPAPRSN